MLKVGEEAVLVLGVIRLHQAIPYDLRRGGGAVQGVSGKLIEVTYATTTSTITTFLVHEPVR